MAFVLRPSQVIFRDQLRNELRSVRASLGVASCGFGKGVIQQDIVNSAAARGKHVLFIVRGRDRVNDAHKRATALEIPHGVLMGNKKRDESHPVQIASCDTLVRIKAKPKADLILIDEADQGLSATFRDILSYYSEAKILGFTATPCLGNGKGLGVKSGGIYESMVKGPSVSSLIRSGYLVRSEVMAPPAPEGIKNLKKKSTGEFDENQGAAICDNSKVIGDVVDHWKQYSPDRKAVAFGFNQAHAFHIAEQFKAQGINAAYIDSDTPDGDIRTPGTREFYFHNYDHGDLAVLSSCGIINRGWDHSICKTLLLCAKTSSLPLYQQRLGRGSRPHTGYDHFRVHDHVGQLFEFQSKGACFFESEIDWNLDGDAIQPKDDAEQSESVAQCKRPVLINGEVPKWFSGEISRDGKWMLCCYSTFLSGPDRCPRCGIPIEKQSKEIKNAKGQLRELTAEQRVALEAKLREENKRKAEYFDLFKLSVEKGYRQGYPASMLNQKHGHWPKRGWKDEAELLYGKLASGIQEIVAPDLWGGMEF